MANHHPNTDRPNPPNSKFADAKSDTQHLRPLLKIDAEANLNQIDRQFYQHLNVLEPCGIDNPDPIFWTTTSDPIAAVSMKIVFYLNSEF